MLKSFFKDTLIYGIAAVLPRIINLGLVAIFTYVLGTSDFSDQTQWYVYAAFINVMLTMGIETSFFRYYTHDADKNKVLSSAAAILMVTSGIFLVLGVLLVHYFTSFLGFNDVRLVYILILTTVIDTLCVIPFAFLRVTGRPVKYMIIKLSNVVVLFLFTVLFLLVIPRLKGIDFSFLKMIGINTASRPGVIHIVIANLIASISTLALLIPFMMKISWRPDKAMITKLMKYGWPIMVGGIAYTINENIDKLIIEDLLGKNANGIYAACYKLSVFMTLYIMAFRLGAEPFFFKHAASEDAKTNYSKIMTWFVIFGCVFMVVIIGYLDLFAGILIKKAVFLKGLYIVPVLLLANLFSGIYNNLSIWYKLTDRTRFGMLISIVGAFMTIVTLFIFVPWLGIFGGAVSTLITYVSMAAISWYLGHKYYPVNYEISKIFTYVVAASVISALCFLLFRNDILIKTMLIFAFIAFVFILEKRDLQKQFFKQ